MSQTGGSDAVGASVPEWHRSSVYWNSANLRVCLENLITFNYIY